MVHGQKTVLQFQWNVDFLTLERVCRCLKVVVSNISHKPTHNEDLEPSRRENLQCSDGKTSTSLVPRPTNQVRWGPCLPSTYVVPDHNMTIIIVSMSLLPAKVFFYFRIHIHLCSNQFQLQGRKLGGNLQSASPLKNRQGLLLNRDRENGNRNKTK